MIDNWPWWNEFKFGISEDSEGERWVWTLFWETGWRGAHTLISSLNRLVAERAAFTTQRDQAKDEKQTQSALKTQLALFSNDKTRASQALREGSSFPGLGGQTLHVSDTEPGLQRGKDSPTWQRCGCFSYLWASLLTMDTNGMDTNGILKKVVTATFRLVHEIHPQLILTLLVFLNRQWCEWGRNIGLNHWRWWVALAVKTHPRWTVDKYPHPWLRYPRAQS